MLKLKSEIQTIILKAQEKLLSETYGDNYWKYQACLGTHFVAQFYLLSKWMERPLKNFNEEHFKKILFSRQNSDGSWQQWPDENIKKGDLDATIIHYFALKVMGESIDSPSLKRAREFIIKNGGVEKGTLFVQVIMAMFGNLSWRNIPYIPYLIFVEHMPCNYKSFSHWSKPHIMAFSYLRHLKVQKNLGPNFRVDELKKNRAAVDKIEKRNIPSRFIDGAVADKILREQLRHGSWNGYTTSTLFSIVALSDYESYFPGKNPKIAESINHGLEFLENLYIDEKANPYLGVSCDGRNWDTILISNALIESGYEQKKLKKYVDFTESVQSADGGVGYGIDFDVGPDVDDTSEAVKLWSHNQDYRNAQVKATDWLVKQQGTVGGWGAFNKDNESSALMKFVTKDFEDSDSLFDFPSADCTGHALEAIGSAGLTSKHAPSVARAIRFLKNKQNKKSGSWEARWAVNHIFGTHVALAGLLKVGESEKSPYIQKAYHWMRQLQNTDGGFGESTDSYTDENKIGKGISTPSQTSWALMTLLDFETPNSEMIQKATRFLIDHFKDGGWIDSCAVGTGHPGSVYMQYNSYAKAFPLLALGKLQKRL
jgi:squalene-hopene/tetraprenyl-beta-curcumene cyclase